MPIPDKSQFAATLSSTVAPDLSRKPNDMLPKGQPSPNIDKDKLREYLIKITKNDIADRDSFGFNDKLAYDIKAYHGIKDKFMMNWPHPRASAYPVPITPVHVDVGYTQIQ